MKLFALYLPQFHRIPENDIWWGPGFTEWTNVKNAQSLFAGHRILHPYDDNYYDLMSKKTVEWQTSLMKEYGIDGLIYYHYYFNGKLLLEKPAENLLSWKDINQPFFFCWANHSWKKSINKKSEIIMPISYGDNSDWETHFNYLLPFFKDDRYEKKDNKPLFMIFISDFTEKKRMFDYFDKRCKEEGFNGLCLIETRSDLKSEFENELCKQTTFVYNRQPSIQIYREIMRTSKLIKRIKRKLKKIVTTAGVTVFDGVKFMNDLLKTCPIKSGVINGIWFEWDNTYRHKKNGFVITPYSKDLFFKYMELNKDSEYMVINAWNEWCEGMILEPTKEYGFKYLEWIKEWRTKNAE